MTLTIVAIIGEAVGTTALVIPLVTAILISRTVNKMIGGDETLDEFQIHKKNLFFLESDVPHHMKGGSCHSLVDHKAPQLQLKMSPLGVAAVLVKNEHLHYQVFPVVSASGHLHGLVSRAVLARALANKNGVDRRASNFQDIVLLASNKHRVQKAAAAKALQIRSSSAGLTRVTSKALLVPSNQELGAYTQYLCRRVDVVMCYLAFPWLSTREK
jgi:hypothetical protein